MLAHIRSLITGLVVFAFLTLAGGRAHAAPKLQQLAVPADGHTLKQARAGRERMALTKRQSLLHER